MARIIFTPNTKIPAADINANFAELYSGAEVGNTAWTSFTPTYSNLTVGNGTVTAFYKQIGKIVFVRYRLTFGTTTSITGANPSISFPVAAHAIYGDTAPAPYLGMGLSGYLDSSAGTPYGGVVWTISGQPQPVVINGSYIASGISSTVPFTWATSDILTLHYFYEAA